MLDINKFSLFVDEVLRMHNSEMEEKTSWEFFLHKVYNKTFAEFTAEIASKNRNNEILLDMASIETTVKRSTDILSEFSLDI